MAAGWLGLKVILSLLFLNQIFNFRFTHTHFFYVLILKEISNPIDPILRLEEKQPTAYVFYFFIFLVHILYD
jgi:hypothetical protein